MHDYPPRTQTNFRLLGYADEICSPLNVYQSR
jgi:hypothetical protein